MPRIKALYQKLCQAGFKPWMDSQDMAGGEDWSDAIKAAIKESALFLACFSRHSTKYQGLVQDEFREALEEWRNKLSASNHLIPLRLEDYATPLVHEFSNSHRIDLYKQGGFKKLIRSLREALKGIVQPVALRSQPINNLAREDMQKMLKERIFFDCRENWKAEGIQHIYKRITPRTRKLMIDHTTGLLWQQSGSKEAAKNLTEARKYITALNNEKYGGYDNWRLPTLEEAMSLTESMKNDEGLCINTDFDVTQDRIWTADQRNASSSWTVDFNHGYCNVNHADWLYYVRAAH